jgi:hypothetical protein
VTYGSVSAVASVGPPHRSPPSEPNLSPIRESKTVVHLLACNIACLVIAGLYYAYRDAYLQRRKRQQLNDRVAYMLWVAANRA